MVCLKKIKYNAVAFDSKRTFLYWKQVGRWIMLMERVLYLLQQFGFSLHSEHSTHIQKETLCEDPGGKFYNQGIECCPLASIWLAPDRSPCKERWEHGVILSIQLDWGSTVANASTLNVIHTSTDTHTLTKGCFEREDKFSHNSYKKKKKVKKSAYHFLKRSMGCWTLKQEKRNTHQFHM